MPDLFDQLAEDLNHRRTDAALAALGESLKQEHRYHELFDARLLETRHRFGLPIVGPFKLEDAPESIRDQVENSYVAACREVGILLLSDGKLREAWMYLRPADGRAAMKTALDATPRDEQAAEEFIEVALQEGVYPQRGFALVLEHFGTCNSITTFESQMRRFPLAEQQACAALLVRRIHNDLSGSLGSEIERHEGKAAESETLRQLVADRPWLFQDGSYHIDTTHLAAVVRFARICDDSEIIRLALDLTEYGRRLDPQYNFAGDEPFVDLYPSHALWFQTLLGENVEAGLSHFRERAEQVDRDLDGPLAAESYIWLLARLERYELAIQETQRLLPPSTRRLGVAPSLMELSRLAGDYQAVLQHSRDQGDPVSFVSALLAANTKA